MAEAGEVGYGFWVMSFEFEMQKHLCSEHLILNPLPITQNS